MTKLTSKKAEREGVQRDGRALRKRHQQPADGRNHGGKAADRAGEWFLDDSTDADPPYDLYGPPTPAEVAAAAADKQPAVRAAERTPRLARP